MLNIGCTGPWGHRWRRKTLNLYGPKVLRDSIHISITRWQKFLLVTNSGPQGQQPPSLVLQVAQDQEGVRKQLTLPPPWATTIPRSSTSSTKARKTLQGRRHAERVEPTAPAGRHFIFKLRQVRQPSAQHPLLWACCRLTGVRRGRLAYLESNSLQELVSTGLSVFTIHVMADTTPAASSFFTRARTKLGLSCKRRQFGKGPR